MYNKIYLYWHFLLLKFTIAMPLCKIQTTAFQRMCKCQTLAGIRTHDLLSKCGDGDRYFQRGNLKSLLSSSLFKNHCTYQVQNWEIGRIFATCVDCLIRKFVWKSRTLAALVLILFLWQKNVMYEMLRTQFSAIFANFRRKIGFFLKKQC
jgi:hypothetical protein